MVLGERSPASSSVKDAGRFLAGAKTKLQREQCPGSFKDPLQDQLTPTNVYLSPHLMMATSLNGCTLKTAIASMELEWGGRTGQEVLLFSQEENNQHGSHLFLVKKIYT